MGSHLAAIGLNEEEFADGVMRLMSVAVLVGRDDARDVTVYAHDDPSGSRATVTLEGARVTCFTPSLRPGAVLSVEPESLAEDDCPYERALIGQVLDGHDELYPMAVQIDDLALSESRLLATPRQRIEVAGLAETIDLFADEDAFRASGSPMAVRSFIPSGLFVPPNAPNLDGFRPSPRALVSGIVTSAEERRHSLTGGRFARLSVSSYGIDLEVAVAPSDLADRSGAVRLPEPGAIVSTRVWLSGRIAAG